VYEADESFGGGGSFSVTSGSTTKLADELIPIDGNRNYRFSYAIKGDSFGDSPEQRHYGLTYPYDADLLVISPEFVSWYSASETTLAADLDDDDTTVTLTSSTGWVDAYAGNDHRQSLILFPYTNGKGFTYPEYTYSRNQLNYAWTQNGITGNVITLQTPWVGGFYASGTSVANSFSGGTYSYIAGVNEYTPEDWTVWTGTQGGWNTPGDGGNSSLGFRQGTAYVKVGWLLNREAPASSTSWLDGVTFNEEAWVPRTGGTFVGSVDVEGTLDVEGGIRLTLAGTQSIVKVGSGNLEIANDNTSGLLSLVTSDSGGTQRSRFQISGADDIAFYKVDGSTVSLLWDESDDQWEFSTDVTIAGELIVSPPAFNLAAFIENPTDTTAYHGLKVDTRNVNASTRIAYFQSNSIDRLIIAGDGQILVGGGILSGVGDPTGGTHVGDRDFNDGRYKLTGGAPTAHTIASHSDTTGTGTELNTLTGGGSTTLHSHSIYVTGGPYIPTSDFVNVTGDTMTGTLIITDQDLLSFPNATLGSASFGIDPVSQDTFRLRIGGSTTAVGAFTVVGSGDALIATFLTSGTSLALEGTLDLNQNFITDVLDPTGATHVGDRGYNDLRYADIASEHVKYTDSEAAAKIAADDLYVKIAGDTMTGTLTSNTVGIALSLTLSGDQGVYKQGTGDLYLLELQQWRKDHS